MGTQTLVANESLVLRVEELRNSSDRADAAYTDNSNDGGDHSNDNSGPGDSNDSGGGSDSGDSDNSDHG